MPRAVRDSFRDDRCTSTPKKKLRRRPRRSPAAPLDQLRAAKPAAAQKRPGGHFSTRLPARVGLRRGPLHLEHPLTPNMGGLSGATIAEADKDSSNAVVYKVGMARMMETIRKLDERDADYAVLRAIESTRRGSAVQFVVERDGVPPYREIVKDQEPEDIGRVPVAVVRSAQQKWADARSATDDQAMFVHMIDALKLPGNKNFDFAGAGATGAPSASRSSTVDLRRLRIPRRRLLGGGQARAALHVPVARRLPRAREGDRPGLRDQVRRDQRPGAVRQHQRDRTRAESAKRRVPECHRCRCPS